MLKILNYFHKYDGNNYYLNLLFVSFSAYLCSFWATLIGEPTIFSIIGVFLNFYFLWKQKSLFDKLSSSIVFNIVFAFFIDFTLYDTTKNFLGLTDVWRLSSIIMISGLIRVPSHYFASIIIHLLQKNEDKFLKNPYLWIGLVAFILAVIERNIYLIVPTEVGFAFLGFIQYLGLLSTFSLLIYSFIVYYAAISLTLFFDNKKIKLSNFYFLTLIIGISSLSLSYMNMWKNNYKDDFLKVKAVQYPFHDLKNNKENIDPEELMQKTLVPILENNKSDLTIFSESSLPYLYENFHSLREQSNISMLIKSESDLLFSAIKKENNNLYNTSLLFQKGKLPQVYYKNYLFPVGEQELLPVTILNYGDKKIDENLKQKDQQKQFLTKNNFYFIPMQCFENYHPYYLGKYPKNNISSFFTVQSNESWITDIKLRDLTKLFMQVRAAENALYGFKVDSMGPSFVVNPKGQIDYITYYPKGSFDYNVPRKINTNYNYFYNYGATPFVLFILLHSVFYIIRQKVIKN